VTSDSIRDFVKGRLLEKVQLLGLDEPELSDDLHLTGSGIFDSMDFFALITDAEEHFGMEIDFTEHDPAEFTTLGGFIRCVMASAGDKA